MYLTEIDRALDSGLVEFETSTYFADSLVEPVEGAFAHCLQLRQLVTDTVVDDLAAWLSESGAVLRAIESPADEHGHCLVLQLRQSRINVASFLAKLVAHREADEDAFQPLPHLTVRHWLKHKNPDVHVTGMEAVEAALDRLSDCSA